MNTLLIDEAEAIKRLGGNKKLYSKLLNKFLADGSYGSLKESMASCSAKDAEPIAHALKGMAANLSLKALYDEVTAVDDALKSDVIPPDAISRLDEVMDKTRSAIGDFLSDSELG